MQNLPKAKKPFENTIHSIRVGLLRNYDDGDRPLLSESGYLYSSTLKERAAKFIDIWLVADSSAFAGVSYIVGQIVECEIIISKSAAELEKKRQEPDTKQLEGFRYLILGKLFIELAGNPEKSQAIYDILKRKPKYANNETARRFRLLHESKFNLGLWGRMFPMFAGDPKITKGADHDENGKEPTSR